MIYSYKNNDNYFFLDIEDNFNEISISEKDLIKLEIPYENLVEGNIYYLSYYFFRLFFLDFFFLILYRFKV